MHSPRGGSRIDALHGQCLGPYELGEIIGRGGMAVVYRAFEAALNRHVAVKVLPPSFLHNQEFRQRFQDEGRTAAQLDHPHIVPIYQYGQEGDIPYLAMPLIAGGTFADLLNREIPLELGILILRQVLEAVDYAHGRESPVIHRDIKPSNILMSQDDYARLADFGIAKIIEPTAHATPGTIAGTPEYMAPEQSQGGVITPRADIYAIGVILYQLLTGRLPFLGAIPWAIIEQHVHAPVPSVRVYKPDLSPLWDAVIQRCLAKRPQDRYPSARALDRALQETWEQVRLASADMVPFVNTEPSQLFDNALRARSAGNWPRVIALCGQVLEVRPGDAEAIQLLREAQQALDQERRVYEIARLSEQAEVALGAERFSEASRFYEAALKLQPGLPAAKAGLERVQRERQLAALYHGARADIVAERWQEARTKLSKLAGIAPGYRDVAALQQQVIVHPRKLAGLRVMPPGGRQVLGSLALLVLVMGAAWQLGPWSRMVQPPNNLDGGSSPRSAVGPGPSGLATPPPAPGTVLYQANWSGGLAGWVGNEDWKAVDGMLVGDSPRERSVILAPYAPETLDYSVEADIQRIDDNSGFVSFAILTRGDPPRGYWAGVHLGTGRSPSLGLEAGVPGELRNLMFRGFDPGKEWHRYRVDVKGNGIRFYVDGVSWLEVTDEAYRSSVQTGLWSWGTRINVRSFKITAL